jgi:hypothetical protein
VSGKSLKDVKNTGTPSAEVTFKNTGKTPAKNVRVWCKLHYVDRNHLGEFEFENLSEGSVSIIAPDGETTAGDSLPHPADGAHWTTWDMPTKKFYINGKIEYTDIFNLKRRTTFRIWHISDFGADDGDVSLRWSHKGNDYT